MQSRLREVPYGESFTFPGNDKTYESRGSGWFQVYGKSETGGPWHVDGDTLVNVAERVPYWAQSWLDQLNRSREKLAADGWDVSRVTIGYYDGLLRACDDTGAYDVRLGAGGNTTWSAIGKPSKALEWTFYNRDSRELPELA